MQAYFLCLVIALFVSQTTANADDAHLSVADKIQPRLPGWLTTLLEKLISVAQEAVNKALEVVDGALDGVLKLVDVIIERAKETVDGLVKGAIAQLDILDQLGLEAGVEVVECTQAPKVTLHELPFDVARQISDCCKEITEGVREIVDKAKHDINRKFDEAIQIVTDCGTCGALDVPCLTKCAAKVGIAIAELPVMISKFAVEVVRDLSAAQSYMLKCEIELVGVTTTNITHIVTETTSCVNDLLHGNDFLWV